MCSGLFGFAMGILTRLSLAKIRTMAHANLPDKRPKLPSIISLFVQIVVVVIAQYHVIPMNYSRRQFFVLEI